MLYGVSNSSYCLFLQDEWPRELEQRSYLSYPSLSTSVRVREDTLLNTTLAVFFQLIFTIELVYMICNFTNAYAVAMRGHRHYLFADWFDLTLYEFYPFVILSIVDVYGYFSDPFI